MIKKTFVPILLLSPFLLMACSGQETSDGYDENWAPGEKALADATPVSVKNPTGDFSSPINKLRKSQGNQALPSKGEANILVVPICFSGDITSTTYAYSTSDLKQLETSYFALDLLNSEDAPSVREYYAISSNNELNLTGVVTPVVTLPESYVNYLYSAIYSTSYAQAKYDIMSYVYDYLFVQTETYYLKDFDSDDDGRIDNIVLAYSYPSLEDDTYFSTDSTYVNQFFSSDTFLHEDFSSFEDESIPVNSFTFTSGRYTSSYLIDASGGASKAQHDSHEYIKNIGRAIGLEEYSDNTGNSSGVYRSPLGETDVMEIAIGEQNPFSLYLMGYQEPTKVLSGSLDENGTSLSLSASSPTILLANEDDGAFGEYLLINFYDPSSAINKFDAEGPYYLGHAALGEHGIKVYKVDSRLAKKYDGYYHLYDAAPSFLEGDVYDFAFTNNYVNDHAEEGITYNFPLVELLKKDETNRHMLDSNNPYAATDMFYQGDVFGDEDSVSRFYYDFSFDGRGLSQNRLGASFEVTSLSKDGATIRLWRHE